MSPSTRFAECHPAERHCAFGLCARCWGKRRNQDPAYRARKQAWVEMNKGIIHEKRRWSALLVKYGITKDQFLGMLKRQDGVCAICKSKSESLPGKPLAVDHNHTTRKVRGLLCNECNVLIASLEHNVDLIPRIIEYLAHHKSSAIKTDSVSP